MGYSSSISWNVIAQGESIPFTLDNFDVGSFKLPIVVDSYLLTERFNGTPLELHTLPSYFFAALLGVLFTVINAFITTLKRFWYMVAMGLMVVFLVSLQLDQLLLFGRMDKITLIIAFVLYLPQSYYFHVIKPNTEFLTRLIGFTVATTIFGLLVYFFAEVKNPFLYLMTYGYSASLILTLLFILMVGAEIISGFVFVITRSSISTGKSNNLLHFLIISGVYLLNLILIFLNDLYYISWKLEFISPFALLTISSIIGIFMYSQKEETYDSIYKYRPTGAVLYVVLATFCFFTIAYHVYSANDPVVAVFKKFIYYSHLGYGVMFFVYILSSFINPLKSGFQVHKILYKPQSMPFFTYRFAGTIAVLALFLATNYETPLFATLSSYYNGIGDLHAVNNEDKIAEAYYIKGNLYGYDSHRSSYALASLSLKNSDERAAAHYFRKAIQKRSSEQAFINLSNSYVDTNKPFEAIFTLQEGLKKFPKSTRIKNNLGLLYFKVTEIDSAFLFMLDVQKANVTASTAGVNILNFIAKGDYNYDIDSLVNEYADREYLAAMGNIKVLYNINNTYDGQTSIEVDTTLNLLTAYELYNAELNKVFGEDTIQAGYLLNLSGKWVNGYWNEMLEFGAAMGNYYNGNKRKTFELLANLANDNYHKVGYYNNLAGLLCLKEGAPLLAADYFRKADYYKYKEAKRNLAIALSEAGLEEEAIAMWEQFTVQENPTNRYMAEQMLSFYNEDTTSDSDMITYWNWKYSASKGNDIKNVIVLENLKAPVFKNQLLLDWTKYHLDNANHSQAKEVFGRIDKVDKKQMAQYKEHSLQLADIENNRQQIKKGLNELSTDRSNTIKRAYYAMRVADLDGDTITANNLIKQFKHKDPFNERVVVGLANYYQNLNKPFEAYDVLLNAVGVNKYSISLLKAYILQCARMNFDNYAQHELERIRELISGQDYSLFLDEYKLLLEETRNKFENE